MASPAAFPWRPSSNHLDIIPPFCPLRFSLVTYSNCQKRLLKNGFFVILNEVKDLNSWKYEILRFAQNDKMGTLASFARASKVFSVMAHALKPKSPLTQHCPVWKLHAVVLPPHPDPLPPKRVERG